MMTISMVLSISTIYAFHKFNKGGWSFNIPVLAYTKDFLNRMEGILNIFYCVTTIDKLKVTNREWNAFIINIYLIHGGACDCVYQMGGPRKGRRAGPHIEDSGIVVCCTGLHKVVCNLGIGRPEFTDQCVMRVHGCFIKLLN